jgi:hypothetical protein
MAYTQKNNPLKKLHSKLQSFGERHSQWKSKRLGTDQDKADRAASYKDHMSKKYGTGEYSASGPKADLAMKPGESQYQYNQRMRQRQFKLRPKPGVETTTKKSASTMPDPNTEIKNLNIPTEYSNLYTENITGTDTTPSMITPKVPTIGTGHSISDWNLQGTDGFSLNDLADKRNALTSGEVEESYVGELSDIQKAINAAYKNKPEGDLRVQPKIETKTNDQAVTSTATGTAASASQVSGEIKAFRERMFKDATPGTGDNAGNKYIQEGDVTYVMLPNGEVKKVDGDISDYTSSTREKKQYRPGLFQGGKA